ncbi:putative trans-sialidase [Leptomonas pyrrhocoris]|uniref:Putative trans-sialidase n=1 Tax=Leptomonas pyrrhocoris TaxID=157538 RepID=A0A0M9G003_LEPPY|nr:putative trans-sialidase [Leptomonas pyrrhocoris]XP_015657805.1 putative trans-sialidase [Leptomonas pyrrhocoris]KPA75765.1 putative trans-sialidase [Leptomonas pyrrhocoris]KPA79366.1 putative trans-sialidase [Leptomonas pyrrhocoris]|eukprot:XP_015654204.1 putative trans-sialidase [Leptomonas pyrrhocoris]
MRRSLPTDEAHRPCPPASGFLPRVVTTRTPLINSTFVIAERNLRAPLFGANDSRLVYEETATDPPAWSTFLTTANTYAQRIYAESTWQSRLSLAGQFIRFCLEYGKPTDELSAVAFLGARVDLKPTTLVQYARQLRGMLRDQRTPLDVVTLGLTRMAAQTERKQARPLEKEEFERFVQALPSWEDRTVFRLCWIAASRWSDIRTLTKESFTIRDDGTVLLDWAAGPKSSQMDPNRASRYVLISGDDAAAIIALLKAIPGPQLTALTTAEVTKRLKPLSASAHSIKRGAAQHAASLVAELNLDPFLVPRLMKHANIFDMPSTSVSYLGPTTAWLTGISDLVRRM